jgi:ferric-dicitrate binding protein FerR (iron transport regulator)
VVDVDTMTALFAAMLDGTTVYARGMAVRISAIGANQSVTLTGVAAWTGQAIVDASEVSLVTPPPAPTEQQVIAALKAGRSLWTRNGTTWTFQTPPILVAWVNGNLRVRNAPLADVSLDDPNAAPAGP